MASLFEELKALVAALNAANVPYALCGGLALAVHGLPRTTVDIDLLAPPESVERILELAALQGFTLRATPMGFKQGTVQVRRVSKPRGPDQEVLILDVLPVTGALQPVWDSREQTDWEDGKIWVVSREGLIQMKSMRANGWDIEDIARLRGSTGQG
jgi:hypothetical protein